MSSTVPFTHGVRKLFPAAVVRRWDLDNDTPIIDRIKAIAATQMPAADDTVHYFKTQEMAGSISTVPRTLVNAANLGTLTSNARFTMFTAPFSGTFTKLRSQSGTTAGVGATLCKMGLYSVHATSGDLTRIAITANDTTLWSAASTQYERATLASYSVTKGQRYAFATLVVGATTYPNLAGVASVISFESTRAPRLGAIVTSQADLAETYLESGLGTGYGGTAWGVLVP